MPTLTPSQALLIGYFVAPIIFVLCAFFTRAGLGRVFGGLVYAGFGLVGWRIGRRYNWKGLIAFLLAWSLWGLLLDTAGSALFSSSRFMVIEAGIAPRVGDFLVYLTAMAAVLLAIRVVGGPFRADPLARTPK